MDWKPEGWPLDFSWDESAASVLHNIDKAFASVERPRHFTNVDHCPECREHDEELSARPRMELQRGDLGGPGWDPIAFTSPHGVMHLMPALARYAMAPDFWPDPGWYADQLGFHLVYDGPGNRLVEFCSIDQRTAVAAMIMWMIDHRSNDLARYCLDDTWLSAFEIWSA